MVICAQCGKFVKNQSYLRKHARHCKTHSNIIVFCQKCNTIIPIEDIDSHRECKTIPGPDTDWKAKMLHFANEKDLQDGQIAELSNSLEDKEKELKSYKTELRWSKIKINILTKLLRLHTNISVNDLFEETEDGVHIYNNSTGTIPIYVHDAIKGKKGKVKTYNITSQPKKKVYRTVKNQVDLVIEDDNKETKVKEVQQNLEEIVNDKFGESKDDLVDHIENIFTALRNSRTYSPLLKKLCSVRCQLLGVMGLEEYTGLLVEHRNRLETFFRTKYQARKLIQTVSKSFTTLDLRLLRYDKYWDTSISMEDTERLKLALDVTCVHPKEFVVYDKTKIYDRMKNYSLAITTIINCIKRSYFNRYGFNNIAYFPLKKSSKDDPYSFYVLERIEGDRRYWRMECRLEDLCIDLIDNIRPYCIGLFRNIYRDVFGDNDYREGFSDFCQIMQEDCEQLLQNIFTMCNNKSFRKDMISLVMELSTINPTDNDKCNLSSDDKIQQKRLRVEKKDDTEINAIVRQMFDEISPEQIESWVSSRYF